MVLVIFYHHLLEKAIQLFHSLIKLFGRQHIVLHRIHLGIIDIEGSLGCLLQNTVLPYDESIVQIASHHMPQTRSLIGHQPTHRIVVCRILHTQILPQFGIK